MSDEALFGPEVGTVAPDTWTVPELSTHLARLLAGAFPDDVWVQGQIRNLNRSANGHVYFQLAEPAAMGEQPRTQLAVTLLAPEKAAVNEQLKRAGGAVRMTDGVEVRICARVRWYGPRGVLQLRMHGIDPAFTLGRLQEDRERILAALAAEGLLTANAARAMPVVPLRVGLITSLGSAAHADVLSELSASGLAFTVRQVDARTQGAECGPSVARALRLLAVDDVDAILLVRGGGARTDLAAFDSEQIARAIAACPVPVLTGIGHEVDRSIADEVAHEAHKTPTAAAASLVARVLAFRSRVEQVAADVGRSSRRSLAAANRRLAERTRRAERGAARTLARHRGVLDRHVGQIPTAAARATDRAVRTVDGLAARVRAHDPQLALARGWSITTTADGVLVRSADDVAAGTVLVTRVARGTITSAVSATAPDPPTAEPAAPGDGPQEQTP